MHVHSFYRLLLLLGFAYFTWGLAAQPSAAGHLIYLEQQTDVEAARAYKSKLAKGRFVLHQLQATAQASQAGIVALLEGAQVHYQSLWIVNAVYAEDLSPTLLRDIQNHPSVAAVLPDIRMYVPAPISSNEANLRSGSGPEWNILQIQADKVWNMGITGAGVTIGGQDTGVDWTHPTLARQYRGHSADSVDHNYHWFDAIREVDPYWSDNPNNPCGLNSAQPCDDHIHGTHTMGTMVGNDGDGNQIGVAPGARWVAARNMDRGVGSPTTYLRCFEWFLAPTDLDGNHPRPELAPDIINNSWYCPEEEGCSPAFRPVFAQAIANLNAAGIFVVVSAGNSGEACETINPIPASIESAFAVGATDDQDSIGAFSARGPAFSFTGDQLAKPDVTAPGVHVRSAGLDSTYRTFSGTSMAGPHVAGTVALMISANPDLRGQVDTLKAMLRRTAHRLQSAEQCSSLPLPYHFDPAYGYGRIDALAAVREAMADATNNQPQPLENGEVNVFPNPVRDQLQFVLPDRIKAGHLRVFDSLGRPVIDQPLQWDSPVQMVDFGDQPAGTYFYEIRWNQERRTGRFMKQ